MYIESMYIHISRVYIYIHIYRSIYTHIYRVDPSLLRCCQESIYIQPLAFGVSLNLNLQSQSPWSLFKGTW